MDNIFYKLYFGIRKKVCRLLLSNLNVSVVCNNCLGADILHKYGLRFDSPTVNLQIIACDYLEFCRNIDYYKQAEFIEVTSGQMINEAQAKCFRDTFGGRDVDELLNDIPMGLLDGKILVVFQHYRDFDGAVAKWHKRFERINARRKFLFVVNESQLVFAKGFACCDDIEDKTIVTLNFDEGALKRPNVKCFAVYCDRHFMEKSSMFKKYYEKSMNSYKWLVS